MTEFPKYTVRRVTASIWKVMRRVGVQDYYVDMATCDSEHDAWRIASALTDQGSNP